MKKDFMVNTVTTVMIYFSGGCVIFSPEILHDFIVERLRDFLCEEIA